MILPKTKKDYKGTIMKDRVKIKCLIITIVLVIIIVTFLSYLILLFRAPISIETKNYEVDLYIDGATLTRYIGEEKDAVVPERIYGIPVIAIGQFCFWNKEVVTVNLSKNVKYIEKEAFGNCLKLKSIEGGSVVCVGKDAFTYDSELEKVELGDSLYLIKSGAFEGCTALTYIPSRDYLRKIEERAFAESGVTDPGDLSGVEVAHDAFASEMFSE